MTAGQPVWCISSGQPVWCISSGQPLCCISPGQPVWYISLGQPLWCISSGQPVWCISSLQPMWCISLGQPVWCISLGQPVWCISLGQPVWCISPGQPVWCISPGQPVWCISLPGSLNSGCSTFKDYRLSGTLNELTSYRWQQTRAPTDKHTYNKLAKELKSPLYNIKNEGIQEYLTGQQPPPPRIIHSGRPQERSNNPNIRYRPCESVPLHGHGQTTKKPLPSQNTSRRSFNNFHHSWRQRKKTIYITNCSHHIRWPCHSRKFELVRSKAPYNLH